MRPDVDVDMAAALLLAIMDGLQMQWLLGRASGDDFDMLAGFDAFLASFRTTISS